MMASRLAEATIETPRLVLRPPTAADFDGLAKLWAKPEAVAFIGGAASSREESWARLLRYIGHWEACGYGFFSVTEKATSAYIGECGFADFKREISPSIEEFTEAGWILDPSVWGRGYALEALTAAISWRDRSGDARPLACIIADGNDASVRLAERVGFRRRTQASYRGKPTNLFIRVAGDDGDGE